MPLGGLGYTQGDTRLACARDEANQRGLTRTEVTFYCKNEILSDKIMEATSKLDLSIPDLCPLFYFYKLFKHYENGFVTM